MLALLWAAWSSSCYSPPGAQPCMVRCSAVTGDCPAGLSCSNGLCGLPSEACPMPADGAVDGPGGDAALPDAGVAPGWRQVSVGGQHACAIGDDGSMWCWGRNDRGALGDMTTMQRAGAVQVGGDDDWELLDAGPDHTCGIRTGGTLWCWGSNQSLQIGDDSPGVLVRSSPAQVAAVTTGTAWTQVSAGAIFTCAIRDDGSLYCWGTNTAGQLGQGGAGGSSAFPLRVGGDADWQSISAGDFHACGIRGVGGGGGDLYCWGYNGYGTLGDDSTMDRYAPVPILAGTTFTSVNAGGIHTCGLGDAGQLYCWGGNGGGATGLPSGADVLAPMAVGSPGTWGAVELGANHTCALRGDAVDCWGDNYAGQLAQPTNMGGTHLPQAVLGLPPAIELGGGGRFTCARLVAGEIRCWGDNGDGQIGDGTIANKRSPVAVGDPLIDWLQVDTGVNHTCGITSTNDLYCWGRNDDGQIGDNTSQPSYTPALIRDDITWLEVVAGGQHTCARDMDGRLWCWGTSDTAQTGLPVIGDYPTPTQVGMGVYASLSTGVDASCAIDGAGARWCWGRNAEAQIGNGDTMTVFTPTSIDATWSRVGNGVFFGCGVHGPGPDVGRLSCWGENGAGELGIGMMGPTEPLPVFVGTDTDWTAVWPAFQHTCGLRAGRAFCWGANESGQLGTGGFAFSPSPAPVGAATDWTDIDTGGQHSCGLRSGAGVFCWGNNDYGQLGDGTLTSRQSPGTALAGGPYGEISAGSRRSCAIAMDGSLWCWGENLHGAIGDGTGLRGPTVVQRQP